MIKPMNQTESNETFRLICLDADAIVIEVESNVKREPNEANFNGELYVVQMLGNGDRFASKVVYVVSGGR